MFKWILYFHGWLNRFRRNIIYQNLPSFLLVTNVSGMFHFKISWFYKFNFQSILRIFQKYLIRSEFIMVNHGANSIVMFHRSLDYKVDEIWSIFAAICCELNIFFNNVMFKNQISTTSNIFASTLMTSEKNLQRQPKNEDRKRKRERQKGRLK